MKNRCFLHARYFLSPSGSVTPVLHRRVEGSITYDKLIYFYNLSAEHAQASLSAAAAQDGGTAAA